MTKTAVLSTDATSKVGESYTSILSYFLPEFIALFILYVLLQMLDSFFIAGLKTTTAYTTLGITNTLFHLITKVAEGLPVGIVVLCGQFNGIGDYKYVGKIVTDAFWTTCLIGAIIALVLYVSAYWIYVLYQVPQSVMHMGIPFLRLRVIGVFFNFVYFALMGFMRGIKNTKVPMYLSFIGALIFVLADYTLIFGRFGFRSMGIQGSALASIIQYVVMFIGALWYILYDTHMKKYSITLFSGVNVANVRMLLKLSWPVMVDKGSLAVCHIVLAIILGGMAKKMHIDTGNAVLASFSAIKLLEQLIILPGVAFAQVLTFLVSNDYQLHKWQSIKNNIMRIMLLAGGIVGTLLIFFACKPFCYLALCDTQNTYSSFAAKAIPFLHIVVIFDLLQLLFSAALRGAAHVKTVMWVRVVSSCFCILLAWLLSLMTLKSEVCHFILVYGSLYVSNACMAIYYIYYFRKNIWKKHSIAVV